MFRKLFAKPSAKAVEPSYSDDWRDQNPVAVAAIQGLPNGYKGTSAAFDEADAEREYEKFCASFCFKPGENLMGFLRKNRVTRLQNWFLPQTPQAEPKAFIRLALEIMRQQQNIWEQPGLVFFVEGRWSAGGPSLESREALSVLAQVLEKPIKLYYSEMPDAEKMMSLTFGP